MTGKNRFNEIDRLYEKASQLEEASVVHNKSSNVDIIDGTLIEDLTLFQKNKVIYNTLWTVFNSELRSMYFAFFKM